MSAKTAPRLAARLLGPGALAFLLAASGQAVAQAGSPSTTVEQAAARAMAGAMPDLRYPWQLEWSAFGVRGGRDVFWHLARPDPAPPAAAPMGVYRRTGWLSVAGRSGHVAVCGDAERIGALVIEVDDLWLGQSDLISELEALNVRATLLERREAQAVITEDGVRAGERHMAHVRAHPALQRWRLERPGHETTELQAEWRCSHPGAAHAVACQATWRLVFRPEAALPGSDCPTRVR